MWARTQKIMLPWGRSSPRRDTPAVDRFPHGRSGEAPTPSMARPSLPWHNATFMPHDGRRAPTLRKAVISCALTYFLYKAAISPTGRAFQIPRKDFRFLEKIPNWASFDRAPTTVERFLLLAYLGYRGQVLPGCVRQMEGKQWTSSRGFVVTITRAAAMANAVLATCPSVCATGSTSTCGCFTAGPVRHGFRSGKARRSLAPSERRARSSRC